MIAIVDNLWFSTTLEYRNMTVRIQSFPDSDHYTDDHAGHCKREEQRPEKMHTPMYHGLSDGPRSCIVPSLAVCRAGRLRRLQN